MSNPFTKKNPFMSLWFSGAHQAAGKSRGRVQAAFRAQHAAAVTEATKAVTAFWSGVFSATVLGKRPRNRR